MIQVIETKLKDWTNKLPKYQKAKYPQPLDENLPKHYSVQLYVGARGSGKTYLAVKYLHELEKRGIEGGIPSRIVLISPTAKSDSNRMFDVLKTLNDDDIIENYTDDVLKEKMIELRKDLNDGVEFKEYKRAFKKFESIKYLKNMTYDELKLLEKHDFEHYDNIEQPKYPIGFITFLFVDDCACSSIFKNGKSYFNNIVIKNRHNSEINIPMNIIICVQQIFNVPKTVRLNSNVVCLFKYGNAKVILEDLYVLVSGWLKPDEFTLLYDKAVQQPHGCLIFDMTRDRPVFKCGWDTILELSCD